jgi:hypothetical protein
MVSPLLFSDCSVVPVSSSLMFLIRRLLAAATNPVVDWWSVFHSRPSRFGDEIPDALVKVLPKKSSKCHGWQDSPG